MSPDQPKPITSDPKRPAPMPDKYPDSFKLIVVAAVLLAGPIAVFSFMLGGPYAGALVLVGLFIGVMVLYMVGVRMGWRK